MKAISLESKTGRSRLPARHPPYWQKIKRGIYLGYRKGASGGVWYARQFHDGKYIVRQLGAADDGRLQADGGEVKDFNQAHDAAMNRSWMAKAARSVVKKKESRVKSGPLTVSDAVKEYLRHYRLQNPAGHANVLGNFEKSILPQLGHIPVSRLTFHDVSNWHMNIAENAPTSKLGVPIRPYARAVTLVDQNNRVKKNRNGNPITRVVAIPYEDWTDEMRRKRKSRANRLLATLKAALNHAATRHKLADRTAWSDVRKHKKADKPKVDWFDTDQAEALIDAAEGDFKSLVRAALLTGCRYGELTRLRVSDFKNDQLAIRSTKTERSRDVPLSGEGLKMFSGLATGKTADDLMLTRNGAAWRTSDQIRPMKAACIKAGIKPKGFHVLRHTYATHLLNNGAGLAHIAEAIGDSVVTTAKTYAHTQKDEVKRQVQKYLPAFGGSA